MNTYIATVKTAQNGQPSFCFYTPEKAPLKSTLYEGILGKVEASSWGQALRAAECLYYKTKQH